MDARLTLVNAITLLYQESQLDPNPTTHSRPLVESLLKLISLPDHVDSQGRNPYSQLRSTLVWLTKNNSTDRIDKSTLLSRIKLDVGDNVNLYSAIEQGLRDIEDKEELHLVIRGIRSTLREIMNVEQIKSTLKDASHTSLFKASTIDDWAGFRSKLITTLEKIDLGGNLETDPAIVTSIDFNNLGAVESAFASVRTALSEEGSMSFGWQGMNRMFGPTRRARRGEFHLYPALPHNYKSGWLLDIFVGLALFNKPYLFDKNKKPALLMISTEDTTDVIIDKLYKVIMQWKSGYTAAFDTKDVDITEAAEVVMTELRKNGWNIFFHQVYPSQFPYSKYLALLEDYKSQGYEIAAIVFDYLSMCDKSGCSNDIIGDDIQDMFRKTREYTSANKILHVTAHQLSTEAKTEKRMSEEDFIFKLPGGGYYERSKKLDTETDFEAFLNKRQHRGNFYLEVLWGKHRKVGSTDEADKYLVLPFLDFPMHGIGFDYDREDTSYTKVGGKPAKEGGGAEWFDLDA